ncbi:hypothetical protein SDC9_114316 [bioreactor metagenome]|uniref:Uncharacterized protein n=1 Tax=bioreactor metagenome TaxID=1076179 RepID=A0A645C097_9ZZZZ
MNQFAGIFFHMYSGNTDSLLLTVYLNIKIAVNSNRQIVLRCLEVLGQIRVIIVFAVKFAERQNFTI